MSVLIKGMEMPKSCDMCLALDDYGDYPRCRITEEQRGYNFPVREQRMSKCPLVPVQPHGRLIDADALIEHLEFTMKHCTIEGHTAQRYREMIVELSIAPTIIPAEEGE